MLSANTSHNTIIRIFPYYEYSSTRNTKLMPYELVFGQPTRSIIILEKGKTDEEELKGVSYIYTKLPTLTTFARGVMWACIMQSLDYMYIQVLVLLVGAYRDQIDVHLYC